MTTQTPPPPELKHGPIGGVFPPAAFWLALLQAQRAAAPMVKDSEIDAKAGGKMKGKKYSKAETWIAECRKLLHDQGLLVTQEAEAKLVASNERTARVKYQITHMVVHAETGLGWQWRFDWTLWDTNGSSDDPRAASTQAWKYGLRGILAIPQADDSEVFEGPGPRGARTVSAPPVTQQPRPVTTPVTVSTGNPPVNRPAAPAGNPPVNRPAAPAGNPPAYRTTAGVGNPGGNPVATRQAPAAPPEPGENPAPAQGGQVPVNQEPMVQQAVAELSQELNGNPSAKPRQPQANPIAATASASGEPGYNDLAGMGWHPDFARQLAALPGDAGVSKDENPGVRGEFFIKVNEYFYGDWDEAARKWDGTGYTPDPTKKGTAPTAAQVRRYCMNLNWNNWKPRRAAAVGQEA